MCVLFIYLRFYNEMMMTMTNELLNNNKIVNNYNDATRYNTSMYIFYCMCIKKAPNYEDQASKMAV